MFTLPAEPQSIGKTLDTGFRLFAAGLKRSLALALLAAVVFAAYFALMPEPPAPGTPVTDEVMRDQYRQLAVMGGATLLLMPLSLILFGGIVAQYGATARGEALTTGQAFVVGLRKFFPIFIWYILYMVLVLLGFVALIVPGFILGLSLLLGMYIIVLEDIGPIAAIKRSHTLVWGSWWRTFLYISLVYILTSVLYMAVLFPMGFVVGLLAVNGAPGAEAGLAVAYGVLTALMMPLTAALFVAWYSDLKARKEGADLAARIEAAAVPA